jgi:hypothetical protein
MVSFKGDTAAYDSIQQVSRRSGRRRKQVRSTQQLIPHATPAECSANQPQHQSQLTAADDLQAAHTCAYVACFWHVGSHASAAVPPQIDYNEEAQLDFEEGLAPPPAAENWYSAVLQEGYAPAESCCWITTAG